MLVRLCLKQGNALCLKQGNAHQENVNQGKENTILKAGDSRIRSNTEKQPKT